MMEMEGDKRGRRRCLRGLVEGEGVVDNRSTSGQCWPRNSTWTRALSPLFSFGVCQYAHNNGAMTDPT
jgi:hypothetical protein